MDPQAQTQGLALPDPREALVRSRNELRLSRRRQLSALGQRFGQADRQSLRRDGARELVGTRLESMEALPQRRPQERDLLDTRDINAFLRAFEFEGSEEVLSFLEQTVTAPRSAFR